MFLRYLVLVLFGFSLISCGNQPSSNTDPDKTPTPEENLPPPDSKAMQEALQGTWCYYSAANGYPLYLGIKVEGENFQVASIYETSVSPEGVVGHPLTGALTFREVAGVIDEDDGLASIPLPSDQSDLTIFNNWVPLLFNGITKNYIKVKYGPNKIGFFKKMDSSQGENCPELKVSPEELARLPQCDDTPFDASCSPTADFDQDGVDDFVDNCPDIANADQKDSDQNGVGDACQTCPEGESLVDGICQKDLPVCQPGEVLQGDQCIPVVADADGDGIEDSKDNCPDVANANQKDLDGDGIGDGCDEFGEDLDTDGDGIIEDNCPTVANTDQKDSDGDGIGDGCDEFTCPLVGKTPVTEYVVGKLLVDFAKNVSFDEAKTIIEDYGAVYMHDLFPVSPDEEAIITFSQGLECQMIEVFLNDPRVTGVCYGVGKGNSAKDTKLHCSSSQWQ